MDTADIRKTAVLAVDDEQDILPLLSFCLKSDTVEIVTTDNALKALELMDSRHFDIVMTDVMMPEMDGLEFLKQVRTRSKDTPVILMTGYAQLEMALTAIKHGAFDLVSKPFDFDLLRSTVGKAIEFTKLRQMEKNYQKELEQTVAKRTAELQETMRQLEDARKLAMQAAQDKAQFLSTVSHEMRTPMNGVVGALDLLEDSDLSSEQRSFLTMAKLSSEKMLSLVNEMLAFTRGDKTLLRENVECFSVRKVIDEVAEEARKRIFKPAVTIDVKVDENVPEEICADLDSVRKILQVLTGNAVKFTESGNIVIHAAFETAADLPSPALLLSVTDTGIGIPDDMLEKIFEPFVQVDGSLTKVHNGVGLGLSLAKQMASHINAGIWAEKTTGKGSCFKLKLPVRLPVP